jgi:hypothetical protein
MAITSWLMRISRPHPIPASRITKASSGWPTPDLHRQSLANAGDANLALAALFLHDRASLKARLDDLGYNG